MEVKQVFFQYSPEHERGDRETLPPSGKSSAQQPEQFYKQVFDSLEDYAVFTTDRQGNVSTWNRGSENLLGYSEAEIIGQNSRIFFTAKDLKNGSAEKELQTAIVNGRAIDERFHVRKDRSEFWASGLMFPLFDEHKQHVGFTKVMRDLTERKKAEEALINAKAFFKDIVDTVREPLIVLNKDLTINTANRAFYEVFKVKKDKVKGISIYDIDTGKWDIEKLKHVLEKEMPEKNVFDGLEIEYHSPQTGKRLMMINVRTLYSISNRREMILLAVEDITERKAMEQQRNDFIGIVSHELKTPVTSLKAFGQVLQLQLEQAGDKKTVHMLTRMDAQVDKLTHLINDLLDATKIEGGKLQFQEEVFSFPELLEEIVEEVQRTTDKHNIIIQDNRQCTVKGDKERVGQVITNFLSNAIHHSPFTIDDDDRSFTPI
jgi:two-component system, OmpR family, phosphate regulon sensor histidine kinase PhoR